MTLPGKKSYQKYSEEQITSDFIRNKLKLKNLEIAEKFDKKYPQVQKFFKDKGVDLEKIRDHSAKVVASGALSGALLLTPPVVTSKMPDPVQILKTLNDFKEIGDSNPIAKNQLLTNEIKNFLPQKVGPLTRSQEKNLEKIFKDITGINSKGTLEGEHLNTTYGYIGAEQHLTRFPGDSIAKHDLTPDDEGMAPGRGAWGYFAQSGSLMTPTDVEREKWYAVVQTLYLPDWETRLRYLRDWYKYRKVLIVNTQNGNAVVADIADSGPAMFTGKNFGGSPEVMNYLGGSRYKKGPVVVFFVDDPDGRVPLGPVEYNVSDDLIALST